MVSMYKKVVIFLIVVLLLSILLVLIPSIKKVSSTNQNFISELVVENSSKISLVVMVEVQGSKNYLGLLRYNTSATEGFGPAFGMPGRASVYWALAEQGPDYLYNKADFDLRGVKIPDDICKTKFIFKGEGVWSLELYSNSNKDKPSVELTANSVKLEPPYKVPPL